MSWLFAIDSLVDFLAFVFALNTMFSFTRVRRRLLLRLQKGIQKSLDDLRPLVEDCRNSIQEACAKENKKAEEAIGLQTLFLKAEQQKQEYYNRLECVSNIFQGIFVFTATVTAIALIFSRAPLLVAYYQWTIVLLIPPVAFFCVGLWFRSKIESSAKEINEEAKRFKVKLCEVRDLMKEILSPRNAPRPVFSVSGSKRSKQVGK